MLNRRNHTTLERSSSFRAAKILFEKKLAPVPLSNNTIQRRLSEMAEDIKQQIVAEIQAAPLKMFAIQLDESTDVARCAQLLVFVRYIKDGDFQEEFLVCHALEATTKGDVFQEVSKFFEKEGRGCLGTMCVEAQQMKLLQCWAVILDIKQSEGHKSRYKTSPLHDSSVCPGF